MNTTVIEQPKQLINDGGPAFPASARVIRHNPITNETTTEPITNGGMTLRDWFAGQALGHIAVYAMKDEWARGAPEWRDAVASESYKFADAMLEARQNKLNEQS